VGLFKKSRKVEPPPAPPAAPVVGPDDLATAHRVVADCVAAIGSDPRVRQTAYALSRAGGGPADLEESFMRASRTGDSGMSRPWRWLAEIVDHPDAVGNHLLVAEIAVVVLFWNNDLRGKVGIGDITDMMLEPPAPALVNRILTATVYHLRDADLSTIVSQTDVLTIRVGAVLEMTCRYIVDATPPAADAVRRIAQEFLDA
jgi:hypothetical protein